MKVLYLDCFSGLSGDMTIGALLDAGADFTHLQEELKKLNIEDEYELNTKKIVKNGITGTKFDVVLTEENVHSHSHDHDHGHDHSHSHDHEHGHDHSHSHDHEHGHDHSHSLDHEHGHDHSHSHDHEHGHDHSHSHNHDHGHGHSHSHDHDHGHDHSHSHDHEHDHTHSHSQDHHHRGYSDIVKMIKAADFSERVEELALAMFKKIGIAEGKIHGVPLEEVHFHEVGAVDSIIDIVGAAILIDQLGVERIISAPVPTGSGHIHIDHGVYPVPAPATLEILRGVPVAKSELRTELTTPTGAAIAAVLAEEFSSFPSMKVINVGYGAGTKTFPNHPNVLRVVIGEQ
ncbi:DUF111 family protein [Oceanobacillus piezotolerans]|uniref:DUF111 family protein n=1 Tax=Oceanobacillus piezotolerans TaxID=2448030 RepID=A0A498DBJ3_9BACI|nr:LarC family nickel insertion protein [Oceanobacillus piezotolerans]RLL46938.1 DUF111 family protein [Oceanobacillus piezotolerans]